jgi:Trm5-related predicted tRNA methylase
VYAIEQLFRVYYYDWHYFALKRQGETEEKLKLHFLGVIYQSNWNPELDYGGSDKSVLSRFIRKLKRFGRYLQSYI